MPNILVVDDDPDIRQLLSDLLELDGHHVRACATGPDGLAEIRRARPDCLLLDVMMPGMSGHDVLTQVRQSDGGPTLPVVMLTAAVEDEQAWRAWTGGVDYFLAKPFDPDEVLQCVNHLVGEAVTLEPAPCLSQLAS